MLYEKSWSAFLLVLDELLFILFGQASKHEPEHREIHHGLTTAHEVLIILAHTAVAPNPGNRAPDHPASPQGVQALPRSPPHPPPGSGPVPTRRRCTTPTL